jgi:hypothetical protein
MISPRAPIAMAIPIAKINRIPEALLKTFVQSKRSIESG